MNVRLAACFVHFLHTRSIGLIRVAAVAVTVRLGASGAALPLGEVKACAAPFYNRSRLEEGMQLAKPKSEKHRER